MSSSFEMTIKCPLCQTKERVTVPTDRCVLAHQCTGCGATLKRQAGSCCVFCAYPAAQQTVSAGCSGGQAAP